MKITEIDFSQEINICPKCFGKVDRFQMDGVGKTCKCGFYYTNKDIKKKIIKYKFPEIESIEIV